MKVILDIKDDKVAFVMELLNNLKFVKAKPLSSSTEDILLGVQKAVQEVKQIKSGKKKSKSLKAFLDEL